MDNNEAIGILRGDISPSSVLHRPIAEKMGAEALEFQGWLFEDMGEFNGFRVQWMLKMWNGEDSLLDYCREEWRKEKDNER